MYGQTEATARMAYLPPDLAAEHPEAVGVPIPGGGLPARRACGEADGVGELVYSGPNVMMGYALEPADLARGAELAELRTGDLGRRRDDGLWEVVGRLGRHAKLFGLRLDLDRVERLLAEQGRAGARAGPRRAAVGVHRPAPRRRAHAPRRPRPDRPAGLGGPRRPARRPASHVRGQARLRDAGPARRTDAAPTTPARPTSATADGIRDLYAVLLGRPDATTCDSFVDLGGDSLSYVEASTRLGQALGTLPRRLAADRLRETLAALAACRAPVHRPDRPVGAAARGGRHADPGQPRRPAPRSRAARTCCSRSRATTSPASSWRSPVAPRGSGACCAPRSRSPYPPGCGSAPWPW